MIGVGILGIGGYFGYKTYFADTSGTSTVQVEQAKEVLAADDPLAEAEAQAKSADSDTRNSALIALLKIGEDTGESEDRRIKAYMLAAEMADPETFDASASAFQEPSPRTALRYYRSAAELGADVSAQITRLEN